MIFDFLLLQEDDKKKTDEKPVEDDTTTEDDPGADDTGDDLDMPDMGDDTEDPTTDDTDTPEDPTDDSTGDDMTDDTTGDADPTADEGDTGDDSSLEGDSENAEEATEDASESLKKVKLARDYEKLYETIMLIIDKFNLLNKTSQEEADLINDTVKNLERLKVNLFDYIDLSYSNKSYEQNLYMYQYFKSSISVCAQIVQKIKDLRTKSVNK